MGLYLTPFHIPLMPSHPPHPHPPLLTPPTSKHTFMTYLGYCGRTVCPSNAPLMLYHHPLLLIIPLLTSFQHTSLLTYSQLPRAIGYCGRTVSVWWPGSRNATRQGLPPLRQQQPQPQQQQQQQFKFFWQVGGWDGKLLL